MQTESALSDEQLRRYSRQIVLEQIGVSGQSRLAGARVLVIGVGGLGSPAALYLAAAGVGHIGIADADVVDLSNLHRQIAHATPDIGSAKVSSAADKMRAINPDAHIDTYGQVVSADNIMELIEPYDFIIDGTDNFEAKFLINDACVCAKKSFSHAGALGFSGQLMTYVPGKGPCYRCVFQDPPPADAVPTCSSAGVIGVLPGVIGNLQALEAIKYVTGVGELLCGRLLVFDALNMKFRSVALPKNPNCTACAKHPSTDTSGRV